MRHSSSRIGAIASFLFLAATELSTVAISAAATDTVRPGFVKIEIDGGDPTPGDVVSVRPLFVGTNAIETQIEIRPYYTGADDRTPTRVVDSRGNPIVVRSNRVKLDPLDRKTIEVAVPFSLMKLPKGKRELSYSVRVFVDGVFQYEQSSPARFVNIGERRNRVVGPIKTRVESRTATIDETARIEGRRIVERRTITIQSQIPVAEARELPVEDDFTTIPVQMIANESTPADRVRSTVDGAVDVVFATNRIARVASPTKPTDFNDVSDGRLRFGIATVKFPSNHARGGPIREPGWFVRSSNEFSFNGWRNINAEEFAGLFGGDRSTDDVLIFVHGYNTSFQFALFKSAQFAHDIGFRGRVAAFVWASKGGNIDAMFRFGEDLVEAGKGGSAFGGMLESIIKARQSSSARGKIHVVAHSMGSRVVTAGYRRLAGFDIGLNSVSNSIFAAPEIDVNQFEEGIADVQKIAARRSTYFHRRDRALNAAVEYFHTRANPRNRDYAPLGDQPNVLFPPSDPECIDCSGIGDSFFEVLHGYFAENVSVLEDLSRLINDDVGASNRALRERKVGAARFWALNN